MAQESLEETRRRLGLSTAPVTNGRTARQYSPMPTPATPPGNGRGALRIAAAIGVLAVVGIIGYNVVQAAPQLGLGEDKWTTYPGTYFEDNEVILANDSLEVTQGKAEALLAQLQGELAAYGFEWTVEAEGAVNRSSNGYNGDSMLYDYFGDSVIGEADVTDPDARADIVRILGELMSAQDDSTVVIDNDNDDISGADAVLRFGSEARDEQALWSAWSYAERFGSLQADFSVFDATIATDDEFAGAYWVPDDASGTLFVRLQVSAYDLLSEDDREAFIAALEPYEGEAKPEYRG